MQFLSSINFDIILHAADGYFLLIFVISTTYCFTSGVMLSMFVNITQYHSPARELGGQPSNIDNGGVYMLIHI